MLRAAPLGMESLKHATRDPADPLTLIRCAPRRRRGPPIAEPGGWSTWSTTAQHDPTDGGPAPPGALLHILDTRATPSQARCCRSWSTALR